MNLKHSVMFVRLYVTTLSGAPFRCFHVGSATELPHKHYTKLGPAMDEHSSLSDPLESFVILPLIFF